MIVHQFNSNTLLDVHDYVLHFKVPTIEATLMCRSHANPRVFTSFAIEFKMDTKGVWSPTMAKSLAFNHSAPMPPEHIWTDLQAWTQRECPRLAKWMLKCPTVYRRAMLNDLLRASEGEDE